MLDPWNDSSLQPPPINTTLISCNIDLQNLLYTCNNIKKVLSKQSPLHRECAILSRFIYKFDKKFRTDIGYRNLRKINTALHKYLTLNLLKDIDIFLSVMPRNNKDNYIPTRQMLQYILIHVISFAKIMMRICVCSKQSAVFYIDRVKRGESHWMSLMPFALLCRIWSFSLVLVQHGCSWYSNLYPYLDKLKLKGLELLPGDYSLPEDLSNLLNIKKIDENGRFEWSHKKDIQITLDFAEDDDINFDSILDYVKEVNVTEKNPDSIKEIPDNKLMSNDVLKLSADERFKNLDEGQSISREYFQTFFKKSEDTKKCNAHSTEEVTNKISLDSFIAKEETFRNIDSNKSLTRHLSFMQWQCLKINLQKLSDSLSKNRKIERKFQKIWQEKCLDYL